MLAVITGDIINSRKGSVTHWMGPLKETLSHYGKEPTNWVLYRGDSFQLAIAPEKALIAATHIKAAVKQTKIYDVRMAIGLGDEEYRASSIREANGTAYINSGDCFNTLKKQNWAVKSDNQIFDETFNIMLGLSLLTTNNWSPTVSEVIKTAIAYPEENQQQLAQRLGKSQSSISEALKRGGFEELMRMNAFYQKNVSSL